MNFTKFLMGVESTYENRKREERNALERGECLRLVLRRGT
jgi:hypothetical protein